MRLGEQQGSDSLPQAVIEPNEEEIQYIDEEVDHSDSCGSDLDVSSGGYDNMTSGEELSSGGEGDDIPSIGTFDPSNQATLWIKERYFIL